MDLRPVHTAYVNKSIELGVGLGKERVAALIRRSLEVDTNQEKMGVPDAIARNHFSNDICSWMLCAVIRILRFSPDFGIFKLNKLVYNMNY